jgi:tRNA(Ile)-lysidine synthase
MQILERVRRTIRQHDLIEPDTRVVVAVSGGSDSIALAHVLLALEAAGELKVAGLAHFNHQLRASAIRDERFCARFASSVSRTLLTDRGDVAALAREGRRSIEDAARTARHEFLERARLHFDAGVVAVGHTRDDQAETFLLRLLRGAGARGLASMHPRRGSIVRPLLDCRRDDLRAYLDAGGVEYLHDESNDDVRIPRNRVRAELLPFLERRFNPAIVDVLASEAALARDEWQWMEAKATELADRLCRFGDGVCRIDAATLNGLPTALARLVFRRALTRLGADRAITYEHVEEALRLSKRGGAASNLPGQRVQRIGPDVVLTSRPRGRPGRDRPAEAGPNLSRYSLSIPGEVWIAEVSGVVSAEVASSAPVLDAAAGNGVPGDMAIVPLDRVHGPLGVRFRRPGDRFRPLGLGGGKKLQDFFVDRKLARERRDAVPLVVDDADRIIWVAGHAIDERFRVMDPAQAVVVLRLKQV